MYRRNISNVLYPTAGLLGLLIVYEAVLKPAYIQTPPSAPADLKSAPTSHERPHDEAYEPPPDQPPAPAAKQLRLIESGLPDTKHFEP